MLVLLLLVATQGAVHYVSDGGGSDTNDCSSGSPCKSIARALDVAADLDEIVLSAGVYRGVDNRDLTVAKSVAIRGAGAEITDVVVDAEYASRVFVFKQLLSGVPQPRLERLTIEHGNATADGVGDTIGGGCLSMLNGASPSFANLVIRNCYAFPFNAFIGGWGGGVYFGGGCESVLENSTLVDNIGHAGGAIYVDVESSPSLRNLIIHSNTAGHDELDAFSGNGGGIYIDGASPHYRTPEAEPWCERCDIRYNLATKNGGGVYIADASPVFKDGTISFNSAGYGGGVFMDGLSSPLLDTIVLEFNLATYGNGGAVSARSPEATPIIQDSVLSNNIAFFSGGAVDLFSCHGMTITNTIIRDNSAKERGGALYAFAASAATNNVQFINNTATEGGAISLFADKDGPTASVFTSTTVKDNFADIGGGIHVGSSQLGLVGGVIEYNVASISGGGLHVEAGAYVNVTNTSVTNCVATVGDGGAFVVLGESTLGLLGGATIEYNTAARLGGGIALETGSKLVGEGTSLTSIRLNTAATGGGIACQDAHILVSDIRVSENTATEGGGISMYGAGMLKLSESFVERNSAGTHGGGIRLVGLISGGIEGTGVADNSAAALGGGVFASAGTTVGLQGVIVDLNTAENGGGLYCADRGTKITLNETELTKNNALYGAGMFVTHEALTSSFFSTIANNTASIMGGAAYLEGQETLSSFDGCTIEFNRAGGNGGGFLINGAFYTIDDVGCEAKDGGPCFGVCESCDRPDLYAAWCMATGLSKPYPYATGNSTSVVNQSLVVQQDCFPCAVCEGVGGCGNTMCEETEPLADPPTSGECVSECYYDDFSIPVSMQTCGGPQCAGGVVNVTISRRNRKKDNGTVDVTFALREVAPGEVSSKLSAIEIVAILFSILAVIAIALALFTWLRTSKQTRRLAQQAAQIEAGEMNALVQELLVSDDTKLIGRGGSALVYQGMYRGKPVAIKKFNERTADAIVEYHNEVAILSYLKDVKHPNVVGLKFVSTKPMAIGMECAPNGSLHGVLRGPALSTAQKLQYAVETAGGMAVLADRSVSHNDLKTRNLLMTDKYTIKLTDFGLSRIIDDVDAPHMLNGYTVKYAAPELILSIIANGQPVVKCGALMTGDLFSFSICLWSIFHQQDPFKDMLNDHLEDAYVQDPQFRSHMDPDLHACWAALIRELWATDPQQRPSFQEALERLITCSSECFGIQSDSLFSSAQRSGGSGSLGSRGISLKSMGGSRT